MPHVFSGIALSKIESRLSMKRGWVFEAFIRMQPSLLDPKHVPLAHNLPYIEKPRAVNWEVYSNILKTLSCSE